MESLSTETKNEIKEIVVSTNKLPKAPWDEGVCKVCGVDKDDDSVLLCDTCDAEYHTYCLNPPLIRIPDGNWYCPSCVIAKRMAQEALESSYKLIRRQKSRKYQGELTRMSIETTARLADVMAEKDYWDFSAEERILLLKLLCDELLSSPLVHQHLEQCAEAIIEMQQKLRSLSTEWKNAKLRQEFLTAKLAKADSSMVFDQQPPESIRDGVTHDDDKNQGKALIETTDAQIGESHVNSSGESKISSPEKDELPIAETQSLKSNAAESQTAHEASSSSSLTCQQELNATSNEIQNLQQSIRSIESQLLRQSIRRDFLGIDANGRVYWGCCFPEEHPRILVDGSISLQKPIQAEEADLTGSKVPSPFLHPVDRGRLMVSPWTYYETEAEISELVQWLDDDDPKERDLRESILCWKRLRFGEPQQLEKETKQSQNSSSSSLVSSLVTKAAISMEKRYGSCIKLETETLKKRGKKTKVTEQEKLCRCECLESILPSMIHCLICHRTYASDEEFEEHTENSKCIPYSSATEEGKEIVESSSKAKRNVITDVKSELDSGLIRYQEEESISPYSFEEICSKFVTKDSNKDLVQEIGLIGSNGVPTFLPSSHLDDDSMLINSNGGGDDSEDQVMFTTGSEAKGEENLKSVTTDLVGSLNKPSGSLGFGFGFSEQKNNKKSLKGCCVVPQAALRRITGKAGLPVFRLLKNNLLDMDVALPEEALRPSKSNPDRRRAWRAFVKSAQSIYELVQATIVLEDMIKTEYLKNEWWYWSSLSAAAKISTLSALSVRIFSLDAAIMYDNNKPVTQSDPPIDETTPTKPPMPDQKSQQPVSDSQEKSSSNSRANRRSGKKRKEPEGS